jgi:ketosteroid isomerase-like protein
VDKALSAGPAGPAQRTWREGSLASTSARDTGRAMSEESVDELRATVQAWNAGDMDAFRELHHPDAIASPPKDWPEPGPFIGREAVMGFYERAREAFDADTVELTGDISHAADRSVSRFIWHGEGHGPESNMEVTTIYTVRNGKGPPGRVLLGPRRSPRSRRAVGVGEVSLGLHEAPAHGKTMGKTTPPQPALTGTNRKRGAGRFRLSSAGCGCWRQICRSPHPGSNPGSGASEAPAKRGFLISGEGMACQDCSHFAAPGAAGDL